MNRDYIFVDVTDSIELVDWAACKGDIAFLKNCLAGEIEEKMLHDVDSGIWTYFNGVLYIVDADKVEQVGDDEGGLLSWREITDDRHDEFVLDEHSVFMEAMPGVDIRWQNS